MKLYVWMKENNMSQTDVAKALNTYPNRISTLLSGKYAPKPEFARQIRELTKNQVTLDDIYDIPLQNQRKNQVITENDIKSLPQDVIELLQQIRELLKILTTCFKNDEKPIEKKQEQLEFNFKETDQLMLKSHQ